MINHLIEKQSLIVVVSIKDKKILIIERATMYYLSKRNGNVINVEKLKEIYK